jgi:hypothetical protein
MRANTGVDNDDFDKKFSLAKTLTKIRNTSNATTDSSNKQLLNSLLATLNVSLDKRTFLVAPAHLFCSFLLFLSKNLRLQNSLLCLS